MKTRKIVDELGLFVTIPQSLWKDDKLVISGRAFLVWCALRYWIYTHRDGEMPNRELLMSLSDVGNKSTLAAAVRELREQGWLEVKSGFQVRYYHLTIPSIRLKSETDASVSKTGRVHPSQKRDGWVPKSGTDVLIRNAREERLRRETEDLRKEEDALAARAHLRAREDEGGNSGPIAPRSGVRGNFQNGSFYEFDICRAYAASLSTITNPVAFARSIWNNGTADPEIKDWLEQGSKPKETDDERLDRIARTYAH